VSRLITGAGKVSPHTAARVFDAMQALNFQPNEAARILAFQKKLKRSANDPKHTRSSIVGLFFPK
jgi:DNA-binding LacI/PurR family transcriptional regulator